MQSSSSPDSVPLQGDAALKGLMAHPWKLVSIQQGEGIPSARLRAGIAANQIRLTLNTNTQMLSFTGGCNTIGGTVNIPAREAMTVGHFTSTEKACSPELMKADAEMIDYLKRIIRYQVTNKTLRVSTDSEILNFVQAR